MAEYVAVETFQGMPIYQDEDGYFWQEGGYFETLEEIRRDIACWNSLVEPPEDTPSLPPPWWEYR